jgi:hypothetical protein
MEEHRQPVPRRLAMAVGDAHSENDEERCADCGQRREGKDSAEHAEQKPEEERLDEVVERIEPPPRLTHASPSHKLSGTRTAWLPVSASL